MSCDFGNELSELLVFLLLRFRRTVGTFAPALNYKNNSIHSKMSFNMHPDAVAAATAAARRAQRGDNPQVYTLPTDEFLKYHGYCT